MIAQATKPNLLPVRFYRPEDRAFLAEWSENRGIALMPENVIPPLAVVAHRSTEDLRPLAFACLYMDNGGTGIAYLEWLIVAPELKATVARMAVDSITIFLKNEAQSMGYHTIFAFMRDRRLANLARARHGFRIEWEGVISMSATTE